jgi:hypothetical protein
MKRRAQTPAMILIAPIFSQHDMRWSLTGALATNPVVVS